MTALDLTATLVAHPPHLPTALIALLFGALAVVAMVVIARLADPKNRSRDRG